MGNIQILISITYNNHIHITHVKLKSRISAVQPFYLLHLVLHELAHLCLFVYTYQASSPPELFTPIGHYT